MGIFSIKSLVGIRQNKNTTNTTKSKSKKIFDNGTVAAATATATASSDAFTTESSASASSKSSTITTSHPIMRKIELMQLESSPSKQGGFGRILDAGTGRSSLNWIQHILEDKGNEGFNVTGWTAVTTSNDMHRKMSKYSKEHNMIRSKSDGVVLGNWFNTSEDDEENDDDDSKLLLLEGEMYDTILVDYLIGAIEGSTPYKQDCIFERLSKHLKPNGRMYIVGLQPIPIKASSNANSNANLICESKRIRDVCVTLAGYNCYREYPINWVLRTIERSRTTSTSNNDDNDEQQILSVIEHHKYPLLHSESDILGQLQLAKNQLNKMINGTSPSSSSSNNKLLVYALQERIAKHEQKVKLVFQKQQSLQYVEYGFDYLVVAEKKK